MSGHIETYTGTGPGFVNFMARDDVVDAKEKRVDRKKNATLVVTKRKAQVLDALRQKTKKFRRLRPKEEGGETCPSERSGSWPTRPLLHHALLRHVSFRQPRLRTLFLIFCIIYLIIYVGILI
jgi:hypothetical protein